MVIGVVTTSYPRFAGDPAGHFVASHVAALRALGHDVDVIAAGPGASSPDVGRAAPPKAARRRTTAGEHGERIARIASPLFYRGGAPDALERGGYALDAASFALRLTARVAARARRWDAAIAHWLAPSALAAIPARVPLTAIAHGGDVHALARLRLLGPALALLRLRRARLVFVSAELRALAARHGDVRDAIVQPMGIDVARFAALERQPDAPPIVAVLARLVPIKGVDVAIAAMAQLRTRARLVVAGDGPERAQLARLVDAVRAGAVRAGAEPAGAVRAGAVRAGAVPAGAERAGAERAGAGRRSGSAFGDAAVELVGALDLAARDELLRRASIVAVPSRVLPNGRTEGMPLAALEALAAGVPVVASAVGGLAELVGPVLVPPGDPHALARAIEATLARPPPSEQLRAAVAGLDWRLVADRLLA